MLRVQKRLLNGTFSLSQRKQSKNRDQILTYWISHKFKEKLCKTLTEKHIYILCLYELNICMKWKMCYMMMLKQVIVSQTEYLSGTKMSTIETSLSQQESELVKQGMPQMCAKFCYMHDPVTLWPWPWTWWKVGYYPSHSEIMYTSTTIEFYMWPCDLNHWPSKTKQIQFVILHTGQVWWKSIKAVRRNCQHKTLGLTNMSVLLRSGAWILICGDSDIV